MSKSHDIKLAVERFPVGEEFLAGHVRAALNQYYGHNNVTSITVRRVLKAMIEKGDLLITSKRRGPYPNMYMKPEAK